MTTTPSSDQLGAHHLAQRIEEWRVERERRLEEAKRAREMEELKECTFEPRVWGLFFCFCQSPCSAILDFGNAMQCDCSLFVLCL